MKKIIFLLCLSSALSSCIRFTELEIGEVKSVNIKKATAKSIQIEAGIEVNNPNGYNVKIKQIQADVFVNNKKITQINLNQKVTLSKKSNEVQNFLIETELAPILSAAPTLLFGGDITLKMKGFIKGKVFIVSKKVPIDVERKLSADDLNLF